MTDISFSEYKMKIIGTITTNLIEDRKHYSYYSELLLNVLLSKNHEKTEVQKKSSKIRPIEKNHEDTDRKKFTKIGLIEKNDEHINELREEFSDIVNVIDSKLKG